MFVVGCDLLLISGGWPISNCTSIARSLPNKQQHITHAAASTRAGEAAEAVMLLVIRGPLEGVIRCN